jgi:hypothetical protein
MTSSPVCGVGCDVCAALRRAAVQLAVRDGIASVDARELAAAAGLPQLHLGLHRDGGVHTCLGDAYVEAAHRLGDAFAAGFCRQPTWAGGLEAAAAALLRAAAADPDAVRFCCVEIPRSDREHWLLREQVRQRGIRRLAGMYADRRDGPVPVVHVELVWGALIHALTVAATQDAIDELPARLSHVLALAGLAQTQAA